MGGKIDGSGGFFGGGEIDLSAGGNVVSSAKIDLQATQGGGDGGLLDIEPVDGSVTLGSSIDLGGDSDGDFSGNGGELDIDTSGSILLTAPVDASSGTGGGGGTIDFTAGLDITLSAPIQVQGKGADGDGGTAGFEAHRTLVMTDVDATGDEFSSGEIDGTAWCSLTLPAGKTLDTTDGGLTDLQSGGTMTIAGTMRSTNGMNELDYLSTLPVITGVVSSAESRRGPGRHAHPVRRRPSHLRERQARRHRGLRRRARHLPDRRVVHAGLHLRDAAEVRRRPRRQRRAVRRRQHGERRRVRQQLHPDRVRQRHQDRRRGVRRRQHDRRRPLLARLPDRALRQPRARSRRAVRRRRRRGPPPARPPASSCRPSPAATARSIRARPATTATQNDCDGCSSFCLLECGDGKTACSEQCDDGNTSSNDGCSATCQLEFCGDHIVQSGEECDDGAQNGVLGDACSTTCSLHWCGDGHVDTNEQCDDANANLCDGCTPDCIAETAACPICSAGSTAPCIPCTDVSDCDPLRACGVDDLLRGRLHPDHTAHLRRRQPLHGRRLRPGSRLRADPEDVRGRQRLQRRLDVRPRLGRLRHRIRARLRRP